MIAAFPGRFVFRRRVVQDFKGVGSGEFFLDGTVVDSLQIPCILQIVANILTQQR
jgi:hypothetical protein